MDFSLFPAKRRMLDIFTPHDPVQISKHNLFESHPVQHEHDEEDPSSELMKMYNSPSPAVNRLNEYLGSQPNEQDYQPHTGRKIAAALAGFVTGMSNPSAGANVTQNILNDPYDKAVSNWTAKRQPLEAAAIAETNERTQKINSLKDYITGKRADTLAKSEIDARTHTAKHEDESLSATIAKNQAEEAERTRSHIEHEKDTTIDNTRQAERDREVARHNRESENIGRQNAASTASRAHSYSANVEGLNAYRADLENRLKVGGPSAQKTAHELAVIKTIQKPGNSQIYSNYYDQDDKGRIVIKPPVKHFYNTEDDFNGAVADYAKLNKEIENEEKSIMNSSGGNKSTPKPPTVKPKAKILSRTKGE